MEEKSLNLHWLGCAEKTIWRGGNFLVKVFTKPEKFLTGDDCMKLKDTYGIRPEDVIKMAFSHGFDVDKIEFAKLLDDEEIKRKSIKRLAIHETG